MNPNDLIERFNREGPIALHLTEEEYNYAKEKVRPHWPNRTQRYNPTEWMYLLIYLRGYTFYRRIAENENQFWSNFHNELGFQDDTLPNYKYLYAALSWHHLTKDRIVTSGEAGHRRTEYVSTIDQVWGFRGLYVSELKQQFSAYYLQKKKGQSAPIFSPSPTEDQISKRRIQGYERVFASLADVVDLLLQNEPGDLLTDPKALSEWLEELGVVLGDPNPIHFVYNKSERVLIDILEELSPRMARAKSSPPQSMGDDLDDSADQPEDGTRANRYIKVRWQTKLTKVAASLKYMASRAYSGDYPIEGLAERGLLILADDRYQDFSWRPLLGKSTQHEITFPEGEEFRFTLETQCLAVRIHDTVSGEPLNELKSLNPVDYKIRIHYPPNQTPSLRVSLRSNPGHHCGLEIDPSVLEQFVATLSGPNLQSLAGLKPVADDLLLVEVCTDARSQQWAPILRCPVRIPPALQVLGYENGQLVLSLRGPYGMRLEVREQYGGSKGNLTRDLRVDPGHHRLTLKHPPRWRAKSLSLTLWAGGGCLQKTLELPPQEQPTAHLARGIAYSPVKPKSRGLG